MKIEDYATEWLDELAGHYYKVTDNKSDFENQLLKKDCVFCKYGEKTTLKGFFSTPVQFVGFHPDNEKRALFYLGYEHSLFNHYYYYEDVLILNEDRIFKMYSNRAGRDFNYRNKKWR
ncbi:MAG: hypothetical protein LBE11_07745 [Prevotellaceae bacterium]|nr:hypothetical protein [Prevotellaceae bacterium]